MSQPLFRACIRYDPPAGGQPLRPKDPRGAWEAVKHFLTNCTDWSSQEGSDWTLEVFEPGEHMPPDWNHQSSVAHAKSILGNGNRYVGISAVGGGHAVFKNQWTVAAVSFQECLDLVARLPPWPSKYLHPVTLSGAYFNLRLRHPATGELLPGQDEVGGQRLLTSVHVNLEDASSATFDLVFPFSEPGPVLRDYFATIRPYLPIAKVAYNCFRHYRPTKDASAHVLRKVSPQLFTGLE